MTAMTQDGVFIFLNLFRANLDEKTGVLVYVQMSGQAKPRIRF